MFKKCIINSCNTTKAGDGVTLHGLPESAQIQQEWFRAILNETGQTVFSEDDVICSKHFPENSLILVNGKKELAPTAIPFAHVEQPPIKKIKLEKTLSQCSVFSCGNILASTQETRPDLVYYAFPKNIELAKKWQTFCNKLDDDFENSFVCSDHFTSSDYTSGPKATKGLKPNACPSIYKKENSHDDENDSIIADTSIAQSSVEMNVDYSIDDSAAQSRDEKMCIIQACQSHSTRTPDLEYYPIPNQINSRKTWIRLILGYTKLTDIPQNAFICSLHFAQDCFRINPQKQNKILLANAVPSIFPSPEAVEDDFPIISPQDLTDPECGKKFYDWSLKKYHEQKKQIQALRQKNNVQGKRIARLAKSIDDFKAKRYISDEANSALQNLFDKIVDAQYEVV